MRPTLLTLILLSLVSAETVCSGQAAAATSWTQITYRQVSGTRPFIQVKLNDKEFLFMVHSQANLYLQTTHHNASDAEITLTGPTTPYGIESEGKVSPLGRSSGVSTLVVAGDVVRDAAVSVFETPQDWGDGRGMDGMLGTRWLKARRVVVDFDQSRVGIPTIDEDAKARRLKLRHDGFTAHTMHWDEKEQEYYVNAVVDGRTARMAISTVALNVLDIKFVRKSKIALGPVVDTEGGPSGALVDAFLVKRPINLAIDGQESMIQPQSWDRRAYSSGNAELLDDGVLGADFMLAHQAIIDFGSATLYLRN